MDGRMIRVLVIEDGFEYSALLERYLREGFRFRRAGDGAEALAACREESFDVLFLDMRFDRVPPGALFGDLGALTERFNGDPVRARQHLEDQQGLYILAELRRVGVRTPAVFSHDFGGEPRRWALLEKQYAPVAWLGDNASPGEIRRALGG